MRAATDERSLRRHRALADRAGPGCSRRIKGLLVPLEGRLRLVEPGAGRTTELGAGVLATIPVGCRVRLENPGDVEARTLVVLTPPQFVEQLADWPTSAA